jgi:hypothetical protein
MSLSERLGYLSDLKSLEYRLLVYDTYTKYRFCKMCHKFRLKFPDAPVPNGATIYNKMKCFGAADSSLGGKGRPIRPVLMEEKLDTICCRLGTSPGSSLIWLMQKIVMSALSARNVK